MVRKAIAAFLVLGLGACNRSPAPHDVADLAAAPVHLQVAPGAVPASRWPPAISRLRPERVRVAVDGLYIVTSSSFVGERGLFVPRRAGAYPDRRSDPSFTPISHGVYRYRIKG
jgi:hypothetical protein